HKADRTRRGWAVVCLHHLRGLEITIAAADEANPLAVRRPVEAMVGVEWRQSHHALAGDGFFLAAQVENDDLVVSALKGELLPIRGKQGMLFRLISVGELRLFYQWKVVQVDVIVPAAAGDVGNALVVG